MNVSEIQSLIWSIAELLRGDYKPSEYGNLFFQLRHGGLVDKKRLSQWINTRSQVNQS